MREGTQLNDKMELVTILFWDQPGKPDGTQSSCVPSVSPLGLTIHVKPEGTQTEDNLTLRQTVLRL